MSAMSVEVPFPVFYDRAGEPLENGYVFIGQANLNPQTNPIQVYFDKNLTQLAAQPLRTLAGYISNAGTPAQVYVDANNFSIQVQDKNGTMVYNFPDGTGIEPIPNNACGLAYTPDFVGAVTRPTCEKLEESVSVKDFGAVGDGIVDDRDAIIAALNAVAPSGTVFFPAGTYFMSSNINITQQGITLQGNRVAKITNDQPQSGLDGLLRINAERVSILNLNFENTYSGVATLRAVAIEPEQADFCTIEGCFFKNFRFCILGRSTSSYVTVTNCRFDTLPLGLTAIALNGQYLNITNNHIESFSDTAILTQNSKYVLIANNVIKCNDIDDGSLGIAVDEACENVVVSGNVIDGSYDGVNTSIGLINGIRVADNASNISPKNVVISNNILSNILTYGIHLVNTRPYSAVVSGNITAITQADPGVVTTALPHNLITGNIITIDDVLGMTELNLRSYEVVVVSSNSFQLKNTNTLNYDAYVSGGDLAKWRAPTNISIVGNVVSFVRNAGIRMSDGQQGYVGGNIVTNSQSVGIQNLGANNFVCSGNVTSISADVGLNMDRSVNAPTFGNLSVGNGENFNFTNPNVSGDYGLNMGHQGNQRIGDIISIRQPLTVPASSGELVDVQIVQVSGTFALYEAICFTDTSGSTTAGVQVFTNSNLSGAMNGTVLHGNNTYINKFQPIISGSNVLSSPRFVRIGIDNNTASPVDCFISIKYRNFGGES